MDTLIINASPRQNGNCAFLAEKLKEKYSINCKLINLSTLNVKPCVACRCCRKNNSLCVVDDDMEGIYNDLLNAERIIFISPNYFGFLSSLGKIFTDRWYCLKSDNRGSKFQGDKKLLFYLTQGSASRDHGKNVIEWAKYFFSSYGFKFFSMTIPACNYENNDGVKNKLDEALMNASMF